MDALLVNAVVTFVLLLVQIGWLLRAMIRVTAAGVPGNSFRKILALMLGTFPLVGWLAGRRWSGLVRREVMRMQALSLALAVLGAFLP